MGIKENWLRRDETCPSCGQVTKRVRGITKQNLKRLVTPKWDLNEVLVTFILILVLFMAYAYRSETSVCREWVGEMYDGDVDNCRAVCNMRCSALDKISNKTVPPFNFTIPE